MKAMMSTIDSIQRRWAVLILASVVGHAAAPTAMAQLPDLFTVSQYVECTPHALHQGQLIHLTWTGMNDPSFPLPSGYGPALGPWEDGVFLINNFSNTLIGTAGFTGVLLPGQVYHRLEGFSIPDSVPDGTYRILVKLDYSPINPAGRIMEVDEGNNEASGILGKGSVDITRLQIVGLRQTGNKALSVSWTSVTNCTYEIWWTQGVQTPWSLLVSNIVATPPTNTAFVMRPNSASGLFRIRALP